VIAILYDEPDFPLTVQTVSWLPGQVSPIHNHATWGVVALISGTEKNTLWRRTNPDGAIEKVDALTSKKPLNTRKQVITPSYNQSYTAKLNNFLGMI
jgi:predicted metal-dependent enzyme (double-stranded beta helix superfamily)